jgi:glycosyltransferase involved in cell wall biosynthesis
MRVRAKSIPRGLIRLLQFRKRSPVAFLNVRWDHHAKKSGYHPVAEGLGRELMPRVIPGEIRRGINVLMGKGWIEERIIRYQRNMLKAKVVVVASGDTHPWSIHQPSQDRSWRLVGVFHHPDRQLEQLVMRLPQGVIDAAVCVSRSQMPLLDRVVGSERCAFIPHGVDTAYFQPKASGKDRHLVISVGEHWRDFRTLAAVARQLKARDPEIIVRIIGPARMRLSCQPAIDAGCQLLSGISDAELLKNYQTAVVQMLPLIAATANNSLLEGMACGLPVVTADLPGVRDYVPGEAGVFCLPGDADGYANAVLELLDDRTRLQDMALHARRRAETLSWPRIRDELHRQMVAWQYLS